MEIHLFRAKSMPQALDMVRQELGPEATVLHTREIHAGLLGRVFRARRYEIAAACSASDSKPLRPLEAPNRTPGLPLKDAREAARPLLDPAFHRRPPSPAAPQLMGSGVQGDLAFPERMPAPPLSPMETGIDLSASLNPKTPDHAAQRATAQRATAQRAAIQDAAAQRQGTEPSETPHFGSPALFDAYVELVEADVDQELARELVERLRGESHVHWTKAGAVRARLARIVEQQFQVAGPLQLGAGQRRIVALVGPTGVGKTTTIAKLAANYRLRDNLRVGLITVDTYRIAAVEQLRTYAEIIDLPLLVAGTPREMRDAVAQMRDVDLVLMDTAGRSPRDEVKILELRSLLVEARPDEVHLVLSAASSARSLLAAVEQFAPLGVTATLITKLDEATSLGALLSLARQGKTPISYLTDGQNVPDDICVAEPHYLAESMLNPTRLPVATR